MSKIEVLSSSSQLSSLASKHTIVVLDFHATWCGPCKIIAPVFESLAAKHASPNKVAFAKVDVDSAHEVASQYSVRAMPTFVILRNRSEVERIQGADRGALTNAVEKHVRGVKPASSFAGAGKGYTLGSSPTPIAAAPAPAAQPGHTYLRNGDVSNSLPVGLQASRFVDAFVTFWGLYFTSLFNLDPIPGAAESGFAKANVERGGSIWGSWGGARDPAAGRRLGTVGNLGGGSTIGRVGGSGGCCG